MIMNNYFFRFYYFATEYSFDFTSDDDDTGMYYDINGDN